MIPFFRCTDSTIAEIANGIMGVGNWMSWEGSHEYVDNYIQTSRGGISTLQGLIDHAKSIGSPVLQGVDVTSLTDSQAKTWIETLHKNGILCVWNSCYNSVEQNQKNLKFGFDFSTSDWDIPDFDDCNICRLADDNTFTKFTHTGTVSGGRLTLEDGDTITCNDYDSIFWGGGSLFINYVGTLHVKMGTYIDNDIVSDGATTNWFSSYFLNEKPVFVMEAVGTVVINDLVYKAKQC
jgi:hypothetical protein